MNYLSVENVSKSFGEKVLLSDISFGINQYQKIALIARNGIGKTTLLNIICKKDVPDSGQIVVRNGLQVAFLPQDPVLDNNKTLEQVLFSMENPLLQTVKEYQQALQNPEDEKRYQDAFDKMESMQAWNFENQYQQILSRFKLSDLLTRQVGTLSGGQKKRLALSILLISQPDLLILDEPTNHLDLEMIEWLEQYFQKEKTTLLMVTHDRYFLERVCNEIIEIDEQTTFQYKGNYSYYLDKKEQRKQITQNTLEKSRNLYKKELDWMRKQPKARSTKSKSRIDTFYEIKERASKRRQEHEVTLEININRLGNKIVEIHNLCKKFDEKVIVDRFSYSFQHGERVGIIGKNGTGKSTFLNMITEAIPVDAGKIIIGDTVHFGYYNQNGMKINENDKVIDVIRAFGDHIPLAKGKTISASQLLERFLFDRKKQYDYVHKLSGGEQKRLYLCTVLIQNPNFLILDEPTNDLDILTINTLEEFLLDYPGCLLITSHDRYFMDKIVDHLFVFKGEGVIEDFPGNYSDFRDYENQKEELPTQEKQASKKQPTSNQISNQQQKKISQIENQIKKLEKEKEALESSFEDMELSVEEIQENGEKIYKITKAIEQKTEEWFGLQ